MGKLLLLLPFAAALIAVVTAAVRWLWNRTLPEIGPFRAVTFWQAFRLVLLAALLGLVLRR